MKKVNDDDKNPASGETAPATTEIDDGVEAGKRIRLKKITVIRGWEPPTEARLVQEFYQAREEVKVEKSKPVGVAGSNCGGGVELMESAEFPKYLTKTRACRCAAGPTSLGSADSGQGIHEPSCPQSVMCLQLDD
jgi:hypothetical protein